MKVDALGNLIEDGQFVGYHDVVTNKCYRFQDQGNDIEIKCPDTSQSKQVVKEAKRTYYWVILVGFIIFIIGLGWYVNKK